MQNEKLKILLEGNYIEVADISHWNRMKFSYDYTDYVINTKIEKAITEKYEDELKLSVSCRLDGLAESIIEKNKFIPPGKQHFIELLKSIIKKEGDELRDLIGDIELYNNVDFLKRKWKRFLSLNINSIHNFVFKVAKKNIDNYTLIKGELNEGGWFSEFSSKEMEKLFKCATIENDIKFLKLWISRLENSGKTDYTERKLLDVLQLLSKGTQRDRAEELKKGTLWPEEKTITRINIFCPSMPLDIAKEHFNKLVETQSKNGKPFLKMEQLNNFIERAFIGNGTIKKEVFNCGTREKLFIVKLFYKFYLTATDPKTGYEKTARCTRKYIKLISDNFTNWTFDEIKYNFGDKVIRTW